VYPERGDTQRMMTTQRLSGVLEPGQTVTLPIDGVCLDAGLFPFASGMPDLGIDIGSIIPDLSSLLGIPSLSDILGTINSTEIPDFSNIFSMPSLNDIFASLPSFGDFSMPDLFPGIGEAFGFGDSVWDDYILDLLSISSFSEIVEIFMGSEQYVPTGLGFDMSYDTILQWLTWVVTDGFNFDDGYERISDQVEETGGSQTPEQIGQLNTTVWGKEHFDQSL